MPTVQEVPNESENKAKDNTTSDSNTTSEAMEVETEAASTTPPAAEGAGEGAADAVVKTENPESGSGSGIPGTPATAPKGPSLNSLSDQLLLGALWDALSFCLKDLADTPDHHAVLVLQATVEAFFLVHAGKRTTVINGF